MNGLCDICLKQKDCFFCGGKGTIFKPMCSKGGIDQKCYFCMGTGHMKHGRKLGQIGKSQNSQDVSK